MITFAHLFVRDAGEGAGTSGKSSHENNDHRRMLSQAIVESDCSEKVEGNKNYVSRPPSSISTNSLRKLQESIREETTFSYAESWAPEYGNAVLSKWPIKRSKVQKVFNDIDFSCRPSKLLWFFVDAALKSQIGHSHLQQKCSPLEFGTEHVHFGAFGYGCCCN
ncbi:hypothetical protein Tco_0556305 [Tanacetum coccineum]